jgi:hypothetical protein
MMPMGYRGKTNEQNRARDLRAQGWTYNEICAELGVAKSSVSLWCRDVPVDETVWAKRVRTNKRYGARKRANVLSVRRQQQIDRLRADAIVRIDQLTDRDLLVSGTALYAAEGSKTDGSVVFPNSDPRMIAFFLLWLRRFFSVDESRLRLRLYLHEGFDIDAANEFWSELTAIPLTQFGKPYRAVADPSIRRAKHPFGCPAVVYSCTTTHRTIMGLVGALLSCGLSNPG